MPLGLKARGGRLQAFVRGSSSAATNLDETPRRESPKPEERLKSPSIKESSPTREEVAKNARLAVPKSDRNPPLNQRKGAGPNQPAQDLPLHGSQKGQFTPRLHPFPDDHHDGLFAGSQLGDDFMNSGLSTPQNELEELMVDVSPRLEEDGVEFDRRASSNRFYKSTQNNGEAAFLMSEDGFISVRPGRSRHNPAYMRDGFQNGGANHNKKQVDYHRDSSRQSANRPTLPLRDISVRRSNGHRNSGYNAKVESESSSPELVSAKDEARGSAFYDMDEDLRYQDNGLLESTSTPKAGKHDGMPQLTLIESIERPISPAKPGLKQRKDKKRRRMSLDYDDRALSSMTYADLQREPFDYEPAKAVSQNRGSTNGEELPERLEQFRHQSDKEQRSMFSTMPISDWEASGEWFLEQFSDLMLRMRDARQCKRGMIQQFEDEAASREDAVRVRSEAIDRKLLKMKQDGQRVVGDKEH